MKYFLFSKTLWINFLGLIVMALEYAGTVNWINPELLGMFLLIANFLLRYFSNGTKLFATSKGLINGQQ